MSGLLPGQLRLCCRACRGGGRATGCALVSAPTKLAGNAPTPFPFDWFRLAGRCGAGAADPGHRGRSAAMANPVAIERYRLDVGNRPPACADALWALPGRETTAGGRRRGCWSNWRCGKPAGGGCSNATAPCGPTCDLEAAPRATAGLAPTSSTWNCTAGCGHQSAGFRSVHNRSLGGVCAGGGSVWAALLWAHSGCTAWPTP